MEEILYSTINGVIMKEHVHYAHLQWLIFTVIGASCGAASHGAI